MKDLRDKVAVVTGASSGIGLGIAKRLALRGCRVVAVGRNPQSLAEAARATGGLAMSADVTKPGAMKAVAEETLAEFGRVDILVNNAGAGPVACLADMQKSDWEWLVDLNLWSVIQGIEAFLPIFQANAQGGHIVNTSSVAGMFSAPTIGAYAATKYAVVAISETLRAEMEVAGGKVGVSVFLPGPVRSNIHLGSRNRPTGQGGGALRDIRPEDAAGFEGVVIPWMEADDAGEILVEGILGNRLYIWTHPEGTAPVSDRIRAIEQSIAESAVAIAHLREIAAVR
ncbi:SDR family NAD(P)-dependent oxidoreductase [Novosphingobium rosa]|uniref:SDR family NAD(P)-dependent oxidoreductase n=1 Tax=Novosphingobium rosa TaxID=76978 RepID=UPI00082E3BF0|nr:SDR family NAD(P)-dependent oxidoreductase [Novosphingobium rosa]